MGYHIALLADWGRGPGDFEIVFLNDLFKSLGLFGRKWLYFGLSLFERIVVFFYREKVGITLIANFHLL